MLRSIAISAALLAATPAFAADWNVMPNNSHASFTTEAPLETIVGNTGAVSGKVSFDLGAPSAAKGKIEVDLATLKTGSDDRDGHMRSDKWLDTAKFPKAVFEITKVEVPALKPGAQAKGKVHGKITIRNIAKPVVADATFQHVPVTAEMKNPQLGITDDFVKVDASFKTSFTNHGMAVPKILFYKVSNDIAVDVALALQRTAPAAVNTSVKK